MDTRINVRLNQATSENLREGKQELEQRLGIRTGQTQSQFVNQMLDDYMKLIRHLLQVDPQINYVEIQKRLNNLVTQQPELEKQKEILQEQRKLIKGLYDRLDMMFYVTVGANASTMKVSDDWKQVDSKLEPGTLANQVYVVAADQVSMDRKMKMTKNNRLV